MNENELIDQMLLDAQKAVDRGDLENLFGRYLYLHSVVQDSRIPALFSEKQEDIRLDLSTGVIEGQVNLRAYFESQKPHRGQMLGRTLLNPMIEIAADRETAKGLFVAAGHDTFVSYDKPSFEEYPFAASMKKDEKYHFYKMVHWVWYKYGVDFIREGEKWKIWHIRRVEIMRCPYDEDWIDYSISRQKEDIMNQFHQPWQGVTRENCNGFNFPSTRPSPEPWNGYTITESVPDNPKMPKPYRTFAETFSY